MIDNELLAEIVKGHYMNAGRRTEFAHVLRVAEAAESPGDRTVALLHDVIEDGIATAQQIRNDLALCHMRGDPTEARAILEAVEILRRHKQPGETYEAYIDQVIESGNLTSMRVKNLDLLDHLSPYSRHTLRPDQADRYLNALRRLISATLSHGR